MVLTTSPMETSTHWKQTVFYLEEPLALDEGDTITGTFAMRPSPENHRELDISVDLAVESELSGSVRSSRTYALK